MIDIRKNVIYFLKKKFETNEYKKIDLANYLGVTKGNVSHWFNSISGPDTSLYPKIAEFFNVKLSELLGIDDESRFSLKDVKIIDNYHASSKEIQEAIDRILNIEEK